MRRFWSLVVVLMPLFGMGQDYAYQVEIIEDLPGELGENGYSSYRFFVGNMAPNDKLSAVFGVDDGTALLVSSTTPFFQHENGGFSANQLNCDLFEEFPTLEYDSYVTIGRYSNCDPGFVSSIVLEPPGSLETFEDGDSLYFSDGAIYIFADPENAFPDELGRVLIGQFTTQGQLSVCLNTQIFPDNVGTDQVELIYCTDQVIAGCMDDTACNYNPLATMGNGLCISRSDMDDSGEIDIQDVLALIGAMGQQAVCKGDLNQDTLVNVSDLLLMLILI